MPSRTMPCAGSAVMSRPSNTIDPRRGWLRPLIERSVVVFPAPFAPRSVTISPERTSRFTPLSARIVP